MDEATENKHVPFCWELRGCHGEKGLTGMQEDECPHSRDDCYSPCPVDCNFTVCSRPCHKVTSDVNLILDPTIDFTAPIKEACRFCEFFLKHGPRLGPDGPAHVVPQKASSDAAGLSTMHFF